jgi:hypothetical protein
MQTLMEWKKRIGETIISSSISISISCTTPHFLLYS